MYEVGSRSHLFNTPSSLTPNPVPTTVRTRVLLHNIMIVSGSTGIQHILHGDNAYDITIYS